jgi:RNA polymerase sigma factor (sigma-70 family)
MHAANHSAQISETELIHKILSGENTYFELLVRRYNPHLYKVGRAYGYNHQDTEDLMQETFISAYLNLSAFENRASLKTWLIRIMLNKCYQRQQKFSVKYERTSDHTIPENQTPVFSYANHSDTLKNVMNRELNRIIECALQKIPLAYRTVFTLRELNGLNVAETAMALSITQTNVKVRLSRAKKLLKDEVEKLYSPEDIFEFNLIYCDKIVERVMKEIKRLSKA